LEYSFAPSIEYDPSQGSYEEKLIHAQLETTKDIFFEYKDIKKWFFIISSTSG
jgi:hypothetical protein